MATSKIKIRYLESNDYKISFVTGVIGGLANNGLIQANFFVDRIVTPYSQTVEINEKGTPIGPTIDDKDGDVLREVQFGILIDINTAKFVADWLNTNISEYNSKFKP